MGNAFKDEYQNVLCGERGHRAPKCQLYHADGVQGYRGTSSPPPMDGRGEVSRTPESKVRKRLPTAQVCWSQISSLLAPDFFFFFFLSAELHSSVMTPWARKRLQTVAEIRKTRRGWVTGTMVCMLISLNYELFPFNPVSKDDFLHMQLIPPYN